MELAEALLALGIGGPSEWETLSGEALKRVYLKKVRAHPPERDPQGFQRVREAYDLLRALEPARSAMRHAKLVTLDTATSAPNAPTPERESARPEGVSEAQGAKNAQESEPDNSVFARLQRALSLQQDDAAADAMLELYDSSPPASLRPPPHLVLSMITQQFINGSLDRGRRLLLAFEEDMARISDPLSEQFAVIWKLLAELVALPAQISPAVIRALASGIESGDFRRASEALRKEIDEHGRHRRLELESTLQKIAPALYGAAWPPTRGAFRRQERNDEDGPRATRNLTNHGQP
jgi:curved DNA-binding protein CbpA